MEQAFRPCGPRDAGSVAQQPERTGVAPFCSWATDVITSPVRGVPTGREQPMLVPPVGTSPVLVRPRKAPQMRIEQYHALLFCRERGLPWRDLTHLASLSRGARYGGRSCGPGEARAPRGWGKIPHARATGGRASCVALCSCHLMPIGGLSATRQASGHNLAGPCPPRASRPEGRVHELLPASGLRAARGPRPPSSFLWKTWPLLTAAVTGRARSGLLGAAPAARPRERGESLQKVARTGSALRSVNSCVAARRKTPLFVRTALR